MWDAGQLLDSVCQPVGVRQVALDGLTLRVNGQRVYARGANWVPADILPGCVAGADYLALLTFARKANMNLLRVWGGSLREKRSFYDQGNRLGVMIWQEFPFACAFVTRYPRSSAYLHLVEPEVQAIVRNVRNHPCVVLWSAATNSLRTATRRRYARCARSRPPRIQPDPLACFSRSRRQPHLESLASVPASLCLSRRPGLLCQRVWRASTAHR